MAERAVGTVKRLLQSAQDLHMALLSFQAKPPSMVFTQPSRAPIWTKDKY